MDSRYTLEGKTALITGAGRGLGHAIATSLADAGAAIVAVSRSKDEIDTLVEAVTERGGRALGLTADLRHGEGVEEMAEQVSREFGTVDILINNAGNNVKKPVVPLPVEAAAGPVGQPGSGPAHVGMTDEEWDSILDTHVRGSLRMVRSFVPGMLAQGHGRVINIGSSSLRRTPNLTASYQVAKGAMEQFTRACAKEWASYGVTVNMIAPGHFRTNMTRALHDSPEGQAWLRERIPMRRTGDPRELGALAVHLAGDLASFITGQTIYVDGGETLG